MSIAGNIEAIRDWANGCFYTNKEIADFFVKSQTSGLKAYNLTIVGPVNTDIKIVETSSDPESYSIKTNLEGTYTGLFYFHDSSVITIKPAGYIQTTYTLDEYVDTIYCDGYELTELIPVMTANTLPYGTVLYEYYKGNNFPASGYGTDGLQYRAFDGSLQNCVSIDRENVQNAWIGYEFRNSIARLSSIRGILSNYLSTNALTCKYQYYKNNGWNDFGNSFIVKGYQGAPNTDVTFGTFEVNSYAEDVEKIRLLVCDTKVSGTNVLVVDIQAYGVETIE